MTTFRKVCLSCFFLLLLFGCSIDKQGAVNKDVVKVNSQKTVMAYKPKTINESFISNTSKIEYKVDEHTWTIKPIENAETKVILLTIDDAPDKYALQMAELLKKLKVPAIFFVNGHFLDTKDESEVLRKLDQMGFEIGNHTDTHANLAALSIDEQKEEILTVNKKVSEITGKEVFFFRAPFGVNTDFSNELIKNNRMLAMNWTYGYDWVGEYENKNSLAEIMVNTPLLHDGAILLMHDRKWTYEALEEIVNGLRAKGYKFVDPKQIKGHP